MTDAPRLRPPLKLVAVRADHVRQRYERGPKPNFKPDFTRQLDPIRGCPDLIIAKDHPARLLRDRLESFDTTLIEARFSSLGRPPHHPKKLLAVWIYAAQTGIDSAEELARQLKTDVALQFLCGGHAIGVTTLRSFRRDRADLIEAAVAWTVRCAVSLDLIDPKQLAADSARIEADASTKSVRTALRSAERLKELRSTDTTSFTEEQKAEVDAKIQKHETAVARCTGPPTV